MANEKRLIDANALMEVLKEKHDWIMQDPEVSPSVKWGEAVCHNRAIEAIEKAPTVDAVSRGCHEQVRWERDVAIEQLESYGVSLGEKADVAKVVHGRWEDMWGGKYANPRYRCSVCKEKAFYKSEQDELLTWHEVQALTDYCPTCGADMRERKDNGK